MWFTRTYEFYYLIGSPVKEFVIKRNLPTIKDAIGQPAHNK